MSLFFRLTFVIYFFSYLNFTVSGQHIIELPEHPLTTNNLGFNFKKVIDARLFKDNIGLLQMNQNELIECNFPADVSEYLESYLKRNLSSSGDSLVLVINDLWVSNKSNNNTGEKKVDLSFTICRQDTLGKLWNIYYVENLAEISDWSGQASYGKKIRKLFDICLNEFSKTNWRNNAGTLFELGPQTNDKVASLFEQVIFPAGLYFSIPELMDKKPSILPNYIDSKRLDGKYLAIKNLKVLSEGKKAFAYSDGKRLYIYANQYKVGNKATYFAPVRETGRFFLVEDELDASNMRILYSYGSIGLAISGAISGVDRTTVINRNDLGFIVDLYTGQTYTCNDKGILKLLTEFPEARERYLNKKDRKTASVWRSCIMYLNRNEFNKLSKN
ncbi:DUF6563 family protein [Siphonobacter sp. SORGH_AS_1065]|uniref:DUF6563 family protein n=1 Tax=Siphonobacter sp. SORGH_AS_1065 TaxID=3041795 RepID=UPI00278AB00C|nr:DUF6563 family protein [Siphonobacter sp. SORGH_AS_1065]MDQ1086488.1 hypothetical protein [Siphonobacter sp. SORGH_AS_1065]